MTTLFSLLSLPKTSDGFTALVPTVVDSSAGLEGGTESPPHKVPRLNSDKDSASAARSSKQGLVDASSKRQGPVEIEIIGDYTPQPTAGQRQIDLLSHCIRILLGRNRIDVIPTTYEGVYNTCHWVINSQLGHDLYKSLQTELERCVEDIARDVCMSNENDLAWIRLFNEALDWFEKQLALLQSLLTYLDQIFVVSESALLSIRDLGYDLVSNQIFGSSQLNEKLLGCVSEWLAYERSLSLEHTARHVIPELIKILLRHHQYPAFEDSYMKFTRTFCLDEARTQATQLKDQAEAFFKSMQDRVEVEMRRAKAVLPVSAWVQVRDVAEQALWRDRMSWVAQSTLPTWLEERKFGRLGDMYELFARVEGTKAVNTAFRDHIRKTVTNIVKDIERDDEMVQRLLDFKASADEALSKCFVREKQVASQATPSNRGGPSASAPATTNKFEKQPDQEFVYALSDAFTSAFKARRSKPAEMIAKYLDKAMRKGQGTASDAEFQKLLESALSLYRFTDDKDVFRIFYHRGLAKRLLLDRSASDDFEKVMLKKLKEQYDPEFGMAEDMFKDLTLSKDLMRDYHSKLSENSSGRKLTALILQRSAWPFSVEKQTVDLPPMMQSELTKYTAYYKTKHSGHVLHWYHYFGSMILRARFDSGMKEISMSLYQGIVLLLFNASTQMTFTDIKDQTNIDSENLRRTLQSLACGKKKLLKKVPAGKAVNDTDRFRFNADFVDPHPKIHINSIQAKVSPEESQRTNASIEDDRRSYLDAAIVRIMKAKKEMTYEQLKTATIDEVKKHFLPQVDLIKKRVEALVEQEYLERSDDKSKFLYVA